MLISMHSPVTSSVLRSDSTAAMSACAVAIALSVFAILYKKNNGFPPGLEFQSNAVYHKGAEELQQGRLVGEGK